MRIGIILTPDNAIDAELWRWCPPGVSLHVTRIQAPSWDGLDDVETSMAWSTPGVVQPAVRSLTAIEPDAIAYACTSGSFLRGLAHEPRIRAAMLDAGARRAVTTSRALLDALEAFGVGRVALATPYDDRCTERLASFLTEAGHRITGVANDRPRDLDRVGPDDVERLAERAMTAETDVLVVSCTALPTIDLLAPLADRYGVPVISSVQITMWGVLRSAGLPTADATLVRGRPADPSRIGSTT